MKSSTPADEIEQLQGMIASLIDEDSKDFLEFCGVSYLEQAVGAVKKEAGPMTAEMLAYLKAGHGSPAVREAFAALTSQLHAAAVAKMRSGCEPESDGWIIEYALIRGFTIEEMAHCSGIPSHRIARIFEAAATDVEHQPIVAAAAANALRAYETTNPLWRIG
jgi:hypothetical protein